MNGPPYREPAQGVSDPRAAAWWSKRRRRVRLVRSFTFGSVAWQFAMCIALFTLPCMFAPRLGSLFLVIGLILPMFIQACCVPAAFMVLKRCHGERTALGYTTLGVAILSATLSLSILLAGLYWPAVES